MIVLDASAVVELLLNTASGQAVAKRMTDPAIGVHVPHLVDVEVVQALRRLTSLGELTAVEADTAVDDLRSLDLQRHAHEPLLGRVWALRHNLSAYDAVYVALAEVLDTRVLTCDGRLAGAPRLGDRVELIA